MTGFGQDRIGQILAGNRQQAVIDRPSQTGHMLEGECDLLDGRPCMLFSSYLIAGTVTTLSSAGRAN